VESCLRSPLAAARVEADAGLESGQRIQALVVRERQDLHQDDAGHVTRGIDPEIGIGKSRPGEAAGAATFRCLGGVDQEAQPPLLYLIWIEVDVVGVSGRRTSSWLR